MYGDVFYTYRQEFSITHNHETTSFLLLDPYDSRVQVTLLHMPVETTESAIRFIFHAINKDFSVSDVRVAPGKQRRHDRWQLKVECENVNDIPHCFILPNMGPEYEDLKIKVFVEGRKPLRDTSAPLPQHQVNAHEEDNQENTTDPKSTRDTLALLDDAKEKGCQATPALQNHTSTHTPSARPRSRPTPSPNEVQPNLKKMRPHDKPDNPNHGPNSDTERDASDADTTNSARRAAVKAWSDANLARVRAMTPEARAEWEADIAEKRMIMKQRRAQRNDSDLSTRKIDTYFNRQSKV